MGIWCLQVHRSPPKIAAAPSLDLRTSMRWESRTTTRSDASPAPRRRNAAIGEEPPSRSRNTQCRPRATGAAGAAAAGGGINAGTDARRPTTLSPPTTSPPCLPSATHTSNYPSPPSGRRPRGNTSPPTHRDAPRSVRRGSPFTTQTSGWRKPDNITYQLSLHIFIQPSSRGYKVK